MWSSKGCSLVGVDGLGRGSNIAGGHLREVRVYSLLVVWRGSSFLMLKPFVNIGGTVCLEEQEKNEDSI